MNNASLELGGTNWAEKEGSLLGYAVNDTNNKYSAKEFTFGRGTNLSATRIGQTGLIEKGRENLVKQSNSFGTAPWTASNASVTSGQSGYDGLNNAWKIEANTTAQTYVNQVLLSSISANTTTTLSVYAKSGNVDFLKILLVSTGANSIITFDLTDGSTYSNLRTISVNAENVGNGWYRCSITAAPGTNITAVRIEVRSAALDSTAVAGSFIYIQDSQVEQGLAASPYIPTTTTTAQAGVLENTPRLNYTTGVANPYLLLEPSRTNRLANSENGYGWVTSNVSVLPFDGGINGKYFQLTSDASASRFNVINNNWVNLSAATYTTSVFAKKGTTDEIILTTRANFSTLDKYASFNLTSGTIITTSSVTANIQEYSDGWYRCSITFTNPGSYSDFASFAYGFNFNASSTDTLFVTAPQSEIGSYATSYIPTYSVSATRAADTSSKADASGEINSTEGVLYAEIAALANDSVSRYFSLSDGSSSNRIRFGYTSVDNSYRLLIIQNGATQVDITNTVSNTLSYNKFAIKYKQNDFAIWVNGIEEDVDTSGNIPFNLSDLAFDNGAGGDNFFGKVNALQLYKEALTDTELATLTTI